MRPDRMLGDHRRKAVAAIGDFGHRASLPAASLPSYPVTLTKSPRRRATASSTRRSGGAKLILRRQLGDRRLVAVTPPAPPSPSTRYQAAALSSCSSVCSSSLSGADFTLTPGPILEVPVWRLKCKAVADLLQEVGGWLFTFTRLLHSQWKSVHTKKAIGRSTRSSSAASRPSRPCLRRDHGHGCSGIARRMSDHHSQSQGWRDAPPQAH
jgi:hypothetical protein